MSCFMETSRVKPAPKQPPRHKAEFSRATTRLFCTSSRRVPLPKPPKGKRPLVSCCPRPKGKVLHKLCLQPHAFPQRRIGSAAAGIERTGSGCVHFFFFFCSCEAQSRSVSFFLPCTKAGCLKGNSLPLWQALNQLFAGLRGGRGTFTQPFSPGCRSPSLPIKSHFLHSMHEARPRRHTRYCG